MKETTIVKFYETAADERLQFAVIFAKTQDGYVFCRHRDRITWELPQHWTYPDIQPYLMEEVQKRGFR